MREWLRLSRMIDAMNATIGHVSAWAVMAAVILAACNAVARKVFGVSWNLVIESLPVLLGTVFLLGAPLALQTSAHIRVDVVSSQLSQHTRDVIELVGHLVFLLPLTLIVIVTGWPYAIQSLIDNEQSVNPGGLPQYFIKLLVPLAFSLLFLQAISELIKSITRLRRNSSDTSPSTTDH